MTRKHVVKIRLTPFERKKMSDLAAAFGQTSIAGYLRNRGLQRPCLSGKERVVQELVQVTNVLNHIAKKSLGDPKINHTLLCHAIDRNLEIVELLRSTYRKIEDSHAGRDQDHVR